MYSIVYCSHLPLLDELLNYIDLLQMSMHARDVTSVVHVVVVVVLVQKELNHDFHSKLVTPNFFKPFSNNWSKRTLLLSTIESILKENTSWIRKADLFNNQSNIIQFLIHKWKKKKAPCLSSTLRKLKKKITPSFQFLLLSYISHASSRFVFHTALQINDMQSFPTTFKMLFLNLWIQERVIKACLHLSTLTNPWMATKILCTCFIEGLFSGMKVKSKKEEPLKRVLLKNSSWRDEQKSNEEVKSKESLFEDTLLNQRNWPGS